MYMCMHIYYMYYIYIYVIMQGGAVVIMDVNDYIRETKRLLNDPRNCKVIAKDPVTTNNDLIN